MSDKTPTGDGTQPQEPAKSGPSARAAAASRARRIGGRPLPGPRPGLGDEADMADVADVAESVETPAPAARSVTPTRETRPAAEDAEILAARLARLRWIPAGVLALVAVTLLVLCIVFSHGVWWAKKSADAERQQVLAAAKSCVAAVTNYDYRSLDKSKAAGLACSTGVFHDQYKQAMETVVATLAPQSQTVQTFQVSEAGIESISPNGNQWVVLVYGQQAVTNNRTGSNSPRLDLLSALVTMDKVGDKWLISFLKTA